MLEMKERQVPMATLGLREPVALRVFMEALDQLASRYSCRAVGRYSCRAVNRYSCRAVNRYSCRGVNRYSCGAVG